MKLHHHTAISLTISGILYMTSRSWGLAAANLIAGIFIDFDHFLDYLYEHGRPFKIKNFFHVCKHCQFNKVFLILHAWEWVALLGLAAWLSGWNPWVTGTFIGIGQHLVCDAMYNGLHFRSYSMIWRWKNDFDFDTLFHNLTGCKYEYRKNLLTDTNTD
ncbi:MAG TPA: hypothetical protein ENH18_00060 [Nitrospirae bacterium]|nr:hypothetical protein [Nitrospirota bacterium]HDO66566.1 hypothetical protein [Nitrospirota bacterium]HEW80740.1 hypothetical protein [Nitrospirota bacterium]